MYGSTSVGLFLMKIQLENIKVTLPPKGKKLFTIRKLTIHSGEKILIKGKSGIGKTTLLHCIAGLMKPAEGKITLGTFDVSNFDDKQMTLFREKYLGIIFQKLNLIEFMTGEENIQLVTGSINSNQFEDIFNSLNIKDLANKNCSDLSLGEQQRFAIARAIIKKPELILADEPTSSLDDVNAIAVAKKICDKKLESTLITVSHDSRIDDYFDRVLNFTEIISN